MKEASPEQDEEEVNEKKYFIFGFGFTFWEAFWTSMSISTFYVLFIHDA